MARQMLGAWLKDIPRRAASIPWGSISREAFDRCFLVCKFACFLHVTNEHIFGIALAQGPSMLPTVNISGDLLLINKAAPRLGKISVGDVVLVRSPENPRKTVVKRVLGMEGDKVTFLSDPMRGNGLETIVVPKDHVWLQGDNIYQSRDSRSFGAIPYGLIMGKAFCRVWPLEGFGSLKQEELP